MAKLYFVRHGLTENNVNHCFNGGKTNVNLLPEGVEEARKLGRYLSDTSFSCGYVSPQKRAIETMNAIFSGTVTIREELREIGFGEWDGCHFYI